ncbi:MAG TPA: SMC family ATPase [bacterium]|nr:SMC family ATPase [bacterium]
MVITQLQLKNYRRFLDLQIEFPESIIGIIGRNGAGKSTLIEAIGWALFGNRAARTEKQDIRNLHVDSSAACEVQLDFAFGGHTYRVMRRLKGKSFAIEAALYRDGGEEAIAVQERGVTEAIESLLMMDYRSFFTSVFARQKEVDALMNMQAEERRRYLHRLLNLDLIDRAREQVRRDRSDLSNKLEEAAKYDRDVEALNRELQETQGLLEQEQGTAAALKKQIAGADKSLAAAKENLKALEDKRDRYMAQQNQFRTLQTRLAENRERLPRVQQELQEIGLAEQELANLQPELQQVATVQAQLEEQQSAAERHVQRAAKQEEFARLQQSLARETLKQAPLEKLAAEEASVQEQIAATDSRIAEAEKTETALMERLNEHQGILGALEHTGADLKEKVARVQELGPEGECPVCTQMLGSHYEKVVADLEKQLQELRRRFVDERSAVAALQQQIEQVRQSLAEARRTKEQQIQSCSRAQEAKKSLDQLQETLQQWQKSAIDLQGEIQSLGDGVYNRKEHESLKQRYAELVSMQQRAAGLQERVLRKTNLQEEEARLAGVIDEVGKEIADAEQALLKIDFNPDSYLAGKQSVETAQQERDGLRETDSAQRERLAGLRKDKQRIERDLHEQAEREKQKKARQEEITYLQALDHHFGRFRLELAGRIRPLISHHTSELLNLTTDGRYSLIDLDEDYTLTVYGGNQPFPLNHFSGGEQDLANLCLRIAISQVIAERGSSSPISMIVLDEVFGSQDDERRSLILNAFHQLKHHFRQIILITHVEGIKDVLPVIIEVGTADEQSSFARMI